MDNRGLQGMNMEHSFLFHLGHYIGLLRVQIVLWKVSDYGNTVIL